MVGHLRRVPVHPTVGVAAPHQSRPRLLLVWGATR